MAAPTPKLPPDLENRLREVAWQYRRREMARGWVRLALLTLLIAPLLIAAMLFLQNTGLEPWWLVAGAGGVLAVACWWWMLRPLWRRVSYREIALYIDDHHPEFQNRLSSAVELHGKNSEEVSAWMLGKILRESRTLAITTSFRDLFEARWVGRSARGLALLWLMVIGALFFFRGEWLPEIVESARNVRLERLPFTVEPGDVRVQNGASQMVWVDTHGADESVAIRWRAAGGEWQGAAMSPSTSDSVHYHEFTNIAADVEYQVQASRMRSAVYNIQVWTPPQVEGLHLTYTYPEYLGMDPKDVPNGGDIAAVEGTRVRVDVDVNKPLATADLVLKNGAKVALEHVADTLWSAELTIEEDSGYSVALLDDEGEENGYRREYAIKAIPDKAPEVTIDFPRGDGEAFAMEEIPFTFKVNDDFGLAAYGIQYEVAGKEPVRVTLSGEDLGESAESDHMLLLEEMELEPGDFLTWTVWAKDFKPGRSEYEEVAFPYFLEIRPYRRTFTESVSNQGGASQGGGSESSDQKDLIIATWNLRAQADSMDEEEFGEKRQALIEGERKLMETAQQGSSPGGEGGMEIIKLTEALERAITELEKAEKPDPQEQLSLAMTHMQEAYRYFLRMRPDEVEVRQESQSGGGQGGGAQEEQLPDIEALETERRKDFHEEASTMQSQQQAAQEAMNALEELMRRQEIINEDIAKLLSELETATGEKEEEIRRQLEKLREEQQRNLSQLDELAGNVASGEMESDQARRAQEPMDEARQQMNRSMENLERDDLQRARTASSRALESLDEMKEQLEQLGRAGAAQQMQELQTAMDALKERQKEIVDKTQGLNEAKEQPGIDALAEAQKSAEELIEEKRQLGEDFKELMNEAGELAERAAGSQELMSQKLGDWLRTTAGEGILEDMQDAEPLLEYGVWDSALQREEGVQEKFDRVAERLAEVAEHAIGSDLEGMQKALAQLDEMLGERGPGGEQEPGEESDQQALRPDEQGEQMAPGPGQEGEENEGQQQGDQPGQGPAGSSETEQQGAQGGQQPGEQQGQQPGESPSEEQSQQTGQQPGQQPGQQGQGQGQQGQQPQQDAQGQQPGEQPSGQQQGNQRGGGGRSQMADGRSTGGERGGWGGATPEDFERDMQDGFRELADGLRDVESLLPDTSETRGQVGGIRRDIDQMRRQMRRDYLTPQYDVYLDLNKRMVEAAQVLEEEIQRMLEDDEFALNDEGEIPAQYLDKVADYFKALSEAGVQQ